MSQLQVFCGNKPKIEILMDDTLYEIISAHTNDYRRGIAIALGILSSLGLARAAGGRAMQGRYFQEWKSTPLLLQTVASIRCKPAIDEAESAAQ